LIPSALHWQLKETNCPFSGPTAAALEQLHGQSNQPKQFPIRAGGFKQLNDLLD